MTRRQTATFLLLCLWSSVRWLTVDLLPARLAPVAGQGFHFLLIGVLALLFEVARRGWRLGPLRQVAPFVFAGVGLFGVPLLFLDMAAGMSASVPGVVVFALVPVVVIVAVGKLPLLLPALAGVAGVLVLVPSRLPGSTAGWEGLGLIVLAAAVTGGCLVALPRLLAGVTTGAAVALAGLADGVVMSAVGLVQGGAGWTWGAVGVEVVRGLALDLPEVVMLLWLIKVIPPQRVAARYLVAPLFTVIEGFLLLKPGMDVRTTVGVALLAGGSWWLLRGEAEEMPGLGLL